MSSELHKLYQMLAYNMKYRKIDFVFPDKGTDDITNPHSTWSRHLYAKHLEFFEAGAKYRMRWLSAANRCGKTHGMAYELTCHLTGRYPDWWKGKRYSAVSDWWVVGQSSQTVQQILQTELLGEIGEFGTGMIPKDALDFETLPAATKAGVSVSGFKVKHISGGYSTVAFKSVEQGLLSFTGTAKSIWIDEPVPLPIFVECLTRTMTGDNALVVTATPITGMTDALINFCGDGDFHYGEIDKHRIMMGITWDDVPHLSAEAKEALLAATPPYQREARSKGIPQLGAGAVYPIGESEFTCPPFEIPSHFKRVVGMDVGYKCTAAAWFAIDPDSQIIYVTSEYLQGEMTPQQHAINIKARGDYPVAIDPAAHSRGQADGQVIFEQLQECGLNLHNAENAREAGLWACLDLMQNGRLKIFNTCRNLIKDITNMSRDDKGKVLNSSTYHIADAFRYGVMTRDIATSSSKRKVGGAYTSRAW